MGAGEISIQLQHMFTFGDALRGAPGQYIDNAQRHMAKRVIRDRRQSLVNFVWAAAKAAIGSVAKEFEPSAESARAD